MITHVNRSDIKDHICLKSRSKLKLETYYFVLWQPFLVKERKK